jgi:hypothetical protein
MLEDTARIEIAKSLEDLADQDFWNAEVWQNCYDLVGANMSLDDLVAYVHDDLIHYTGKPLFDPLAKPRDFAPYRQQFRDIASALRSRMSLADYKKSYE